MKTRQLILLLSTSAILGACVAIEPPRPVIVEPHYATPYMTADGMDMNTPVYMAAYPEYTFYHRYDVSCDCIRIVRMVEIGGVVFWLDHTGRRVHDGHWTPAPPSHHAVDHYRSWSFDHRTEFQHTQFPHPAERPRPPHVTPPAPAPAPQNLAVKPPPAQPLVGPHDRGEHEIKYWPGENGVGNLRKMTPAPNSNAAKVEDKASTQDPKPRRKDGPTGKDVPSPKPAPDIKPAPAPAAKTGEKPGSKDEHEHEHNHDQDHERHPSDRQEGAQK